MDLETLHRNLHATLIIAPFGLFLPQLASANLAEGSVSPADPAGRQKTFSFVGQARP